MYSKSWSMQTLVNTMQLAPKLQLQIHRSSCSTKKTVTDTLSKDTNPNMAPNGCQCFLGVVSLLVQKYFIHICAPQLSQENTHHLKHKKALPSKPYCLYISKHRKAAVLLSGKERTLFTMIAASVLPSWLFPVTFIHLLMPATTAK